MTEDKILYGNKLIAEFMQYKQNIGFNEYFNHNDYEIPGKEYYRYIQKIEENIKTNSYSLNALKFHSSWDWLMPVVEKIESIDLSEYMYKWTEDGKTRYNFCGISVDIENTKCMIYMELSLDPICVMNKETTQQKYESKLESVYCSVIESIEWYNQYLEKYNEEK